MPEREDTRKEDFVMSSKYAGGEEREEPYEYTASEDNAAKRSLKPVLIAGGGLLVAVIVVLMFLSGSPKSAEKDQIKSIETRLKQIEEKLAKLEWIDTGMARLDRKEKDFAALAERMTQMESSMNRRIDQLGKEVVRPAAKQEPATAKPESAPPGRRPHLPNPHPPPRKPRRIPKRKFTWLKKGRRSTASVGATASRPNSSSSSTTCRPKTRSGPVKSSSWAPRKQTEANPVPPDPTG